MRPTSSTRSWGRWLGALAALLAVAWPGSAHAFREFVAFGADAGGAPHVKVADSRTGALRASFLAYDVAFRGGVRVALGDVTGDAVDDLVTAPGPGGGPHIKVFGGAQLLLGQAVEIAGFLATDPAFAFGLYLAVGEVDGSNGTAREVIVGYGEGGEPRVRGFRIAGGTGVPVAGPLADLIAYDAGFRGGVRVAAADLYGGSPNEVVTGAGPGGAPHVKIFDAGTGDVVHEFLAYDAGLAGGVYVAAGHLTGGPEAEVVTGPGAGASPEVRVFEVAAGGQTLVAAFFCYDSSFQGGVRVGYVPELLEVLCVPGPGNVSLAVFNAPPFASAGNDIAAYHSLGALVFPNFHGGVFTSPN
jgi:hypothetical protein